MFSDFFTKLDFLLGGVDANVKILLNIAQFRTFASIKSIESVDEIYEAIERRVRKIKHRSPEKHLLKDLLLRKVEVEQFTISTPHRSEIKTIFNKIQTMEVKDFVDISTHPKAVIKSEHSDSQGIVLHRLNSFLKRRLGDTEQEDIDFQLLKQPSEINQHVEKWTLVCPLAGCDMRIKIAYDNAKVHVRSEGYERHLKMVHPNKEDLVLKSKLQTERIENARRDCRLDQYSNNCRCCLKALEDDKYFEINSSTEAMFIEFTSFLLISSDKLSNKICLNCNLILSSNLNNKRRFIANQKLLEQLLQNEPVSIKTEAFEYDSEYPIEDSRDDWSTPFPEPELNLKVEDEGDWLADDDYDESFDEYFPPPSKKKKLKKSFLLEKIPKQPKIKFGLKTINGFLTCEDCDYKTKKITSMQGHQWKIHNGPKPVGQFICEHCSKDFREKQGLKRHLDWHANVKRFFCDHCEFKTHAKADLLNHLLTHEQFRPPRRFHCDFEGCNKSFHHPRTLRHHKTSFHLKLRNFECPMCSKRFARICSVRSHVAFVHQKIRKFHCDFGEGCEANFAYKSHLDRHKRKIHKLTV